MLTILENIVFAIYNLLPDSPFQQLELQGIETDYLGWLNWFVPFDTCSTIIKTWLVCILAYYSWDLIKHVVLNLLNSFLNG